MAEPDDAPPADLTPAVDATPRLARVSHGAAALVGARGASSAIAAAVITVICWPVVSFVPEAGLDQSWKAALAMSLNDNIRWGRDLVFTYGPLGFLPYPEAFFGNTLAVSWLYVLAVEFGLALLLVVSLRSVIGFPAAVLVAFAATPLLSINMTEAAPLIALGVACLAIEGRLGRLAPAAVPALAAFAALQLLIKFSGGPVCLGLAILTALALGDGKLLRAGIAVGTFVVSFLALWLVLGQSLGDIAPWLHGGISVTEGYTGAMSFSDPNGQWQYVVALATTIAIGLLVWRHSSSMSRLSRWCLLLCFAGVAYAYFKEAFVRQDGAHTPIFFAAIAIMALVPAWERERRMLAYATAAVIAVTLLAVASINPTHTWDVATNVSRVSSQVQLLASSHDRRAAVVSSQMHVASELGVAPSLLAALQGKTVDVMPYETTAAWALNLDWRPLPVFQDYSAYTDYLDQRNADALAGSRAPERLLRQDSYHVDNRFGSFEAPRTFLSVLCRYEEVAVAMPWQVAARVPDRCGAPRRISEQTVRPGVPVAVPQAGKSDIVYASLHIASHPLASLGAALFKPVSVPVLTVDGAGYRLVTSVADGPGVLDVPASSGFSAGFGGELAARQISVERVSGSIRIDFYAVHIRAAKASH